VFLEHLQQQSGYTSVVQMERTTLYVSLAGLKTQKNIPNVFAGLFKDAIIAQGFFMAQRRMFQRELKPNP